MAKKVKCIECDNSMDWAIPNAEIIKGNEHLQNTLKNYIVCGYTMKSKHIDHCQYCKNYENDGSGWRNKCRKHYENSLEQALKQISE